MALISNVVTGGTIAATWGNAVRDATVQVTTSAARPSSPAEGMVIYETDTGLLLAYNGTAWSQIANGDTTNVFGTWTTFTATIVQGATPTQTTQYARFARVGKLVMGNVYISFSSSGGGTAGQPITCTTSGLPAPVRQLNVGSWLANKTSDGLYNGALQLNTSTTFIFYVATGGVYTTQWGASGGGMNTVAIGGGASDHVEFNFTYEAA